MKEYFDEDGHLTPIALQDTLNGVADEFSRLEIAEHLSFCDKCMEHYCMLLEDAPLISPPEPLGPGVRSDLRRQARILFLNRYLRVGVAACLTLLLWLGGVFSINVKTEERLPIRSFSYAADSFGQKAVEFGQQMTDSINEFFDQLILKGDHSYEKK